MPKSQTNHRVRALIIKNDQILLIYRYKKGRQYWVFPGGGIEYSDPSARAAIQRECMEELNIEVIPQEKATFTISHEESEGVTEEAFYTCQITTGTLGYGSGPEFSRPNAGVYVFAWVPLTKIKELPLYPEEAVKLTLTTAAQPE